MNSVDSLFVLRFVSDLGEPADCIDAADVNCDADVNAVDSLKILRHVADLGDASAPGCAAIGAYAASGSGAHVGRPPWFRVPAILRGY